MGEKNRCISFLSGVEDAKYLQIGVCMVWVINLSVLLVLFIMMIKGEHNYEKTHWWKIGFSFFN